MSMKTILVPTEKHDTIDAVLQTAVLFANRYGSYIEGVPLRPAYTEFAAIDVYAGAPLPRPPSEDRELAQEARGLFEAAMQSGRVPRAGPDRKGPSFGWKESELMSEGHLASVARVFDITMFGRPSATGVAPRMSSLEATLFESGRPILIVPARAPKTIGETMVIAWNRSTETANTTAHAMPLLAKAKRVVVLTVEGQGGTVPGPSGRMLVENLRSNDIAAEELSVQAGRRPAGEVMLSEATRIGCDLLVKGAYTQSRLRQMIFGGATSHILSAAELPVFMTH